MIYIKQNSSSLIWLGLLLITYTSFAQSNCQELRLLNTIENDDVSDFYIKIYRESQSTVQYDHNKGSICIPNELYHKADSIVIHKNFKEFVLPSAYDFKNPYPIDVQSQLEEVVVSSKKQVITIGPTKAKRIVHTISSGQGTATLFKIDSTHARKYVDQLKIHFRGQGPFVPGRSYLSSFEVILLHTYNEDLSELTELLPEEKSSHIVDFRGRGWLSVDVSRESIQIPHEGYIIYGIKAVEGTLHITANSAEKNPGITPIMLAFNKWQQFGEPKIKAYRSNTYVRRMMLQLSVQY